MACRRLIFAFLALLSFPAFSAGSVVGYIVYITLREFKSTQTGVSAETGQPIFTASYTPNYYTLAKYVVGSIKPTYQSLGLVQYKDLQGNSPPSPVTSQYSLYLVVNLVTKKVTTELPNVDYTPLGDLSLSHPLYPIYEGTVLPYGADDYGRYQGVNLSFGENGLNFLQGRVSPADGSAPQFYYYDPNTGDVIITDSPNTNMGTYSYDPETGALTYTAWHDPNSGSSSGSVDLSPVVDAINTQGGLTRSQLVSLLGSNGNSWVYDCSLSLQQLYNLAINSGLLVQIAPSQLDDIQYFISSSAEDQKSQMSIVGGSIVSAIEGIEVSPVVNVAAPTVNIDTSTLAKDSTLQAFFDNLKVSGKGFNYYIQNISSKVQNSDTRLTAIWGLVNNIISRLSLWDQNNDITYSPADFGDTTPAQELPEGFQDSASSFPSSVSQTLGTLTDWGDNGVPSAFDFNPISGLLNTFVGSIPSVGSDATIMEVDFDLPYIGRIHRIYRWDDFPYISEFRQFLLWCLYVFFGIACFKLIHKSIF